MEELRVVSELHFCLVKPGEDNAATLVGGRKRLPYPKNASVCRLISHESCTHTKIQVQSGIPENNFQSSSKGTCQSWTNQPAGSSNVPRLAAFSMLFRFATEIYSFVNLVDESYSAARRDLPRDVSLVRLGSTDPCSGLLSTAHLQYSSLICSRAADGATVVLTCVVLPVSCVLYHAETCYVLEVCAVY